MIQDLDQNFNEGRDQIVLYEEVLRALPKNHLEFMRVSCYNMSCVSKSHYLCVCVSRNPNLSPPYRMQ